MTFLFPSPAFHSPFPIIFLQNSLVMHCLHNVHELNAHGEDSVRLSVIYFNMGSTGRIFTKPCIRYPYKNLLGHLEFHEDKNRRSTLSYRIKCV